MKLNSTQPGRLTHICTYTNAGIMGLLIIYFFLAPGFIVMTNLSDNAWETRDIPKVAWRLHKDMTTRYADWANRRIASGQAAHLILYDVPSTEWPMFGSVFYLMATESLQQTWEKNQGPGKEPPKVYARKAIDAALAVVLDPVHHSWVKTHWGDDYMHEQNVFFRMMVMGAIISHENLIGSGEHLELLRDQADTLAQSLDESKWGVLEDYPQECYPIDVVAAIAMIQRADKLLGTDHSAFLKRAVRGFTGKMADKIGLVPYFVYLPSGAQRDPSRGTGNSFILIFAHELWPEVAKTWYDLYQEHFWQDNGIISGFREFPIGMPDRNWLYDVDAGPILGGFSPAANAFGLAAAIENARLDHANTLYAQVLPAAWPLPDGSLLGPKILSHPHAPYLGEACLLFMITRRPPEDLEIVNGGHKPGLLYIGYLFFFGLGGLLLYSVIRKIRLYRRRRPNLSIFGEHFQVIVWGILLLTSLGALLLGFGRTGAIICLIALMLPLTRYHKPNKKAEQPKGCSASKNVTR